MLAAVDLTHVRIEDDFWTPRLEVNRRRTLPHNIKWCEQTGRLANFEKVGAGTTGGHQGWFFNDSDVYKLIEGAAYTLAAQPDQALEEKMDDWIATIANAQCPDGYLNTYFQLNPAPERWTQDQYHELYCAGHLFEAAIAYHRATGKTRLLEAACKLADHIDSVFGPGRRQMAPEHPEIELALIRLWRATGEQRYLNLAQFFIEQRGRYETRPTWKERAQDHLPIRQQSAIAGHAVRAMYLFSAVTDLAAITGDEGYLLALERVWTDLVSHKMYITGGTGVWDHEEGFAGAYDLPNERSYAETCAAIGLAFWSHRLALVHHDAGFADVFERVLYNAILAAVSLDGEKFLYANPLASRGVAGFQTSGGAQGGSRSHRQHWFECACCPPNLLRFIAALAGYVYAYSDNAIYINLYVAGQAEVVLGGDRVRLTQKTGYPWEGVIELTVEPRQSKEFELFVRVPGWCDNARLTMNGQPVGEPEITRGYARLARHWRGGDLVKLELPMPVCRIECDPRVPGNAGRVALQRGPLIYCLETADNPDGVWNLALPPEDHVAAEHRPDLLGGVMVLSGTARRRAAEEWGDRLYRPRPSQLPAASLTMFTAVPYCVWDNRAPGEMVVWLPQDPCAAEPTR